MSSCQVSSQGEVAVVLLLTIIAIDIRAEGTEHFVISTCIRKSASEQDSLLLYTHSLNPSRTRYIAIAYLGMSQLPEQLSLDNSGLVTGSVSNCSATLCRSCLVSLCFA